MGRRLLTMLATGLAGIALGDAAHAQCTFKVPDDALVKPGTLTMSTNPTLPPLQYVDATGELKGMRIDLGTEIAKRLCLTPEYVRIEFSAMVPGLQAGRWDMIDTGIFFTAERAKIMQMIPYENNAISVSVPAGNSAKITRIEDLAGMAIGVEIGGFEEKQAKALAAKVKDAGLAEPVVRTFDNFSTAFQALRAGQVDAVVTIDATAKEYESRGDFARALNGLAPTPVALAFKSRPLAEAVKAVLDGMKRDGSYQKLFERYGLIPFPGDVFEIKGPAA